MTPFEKFVRRRSAELVGAALSGQPAPPPMVSHVPQRPSFLEPPAAMRKASPPVLTAAMRHMLAARQQAQVDAESDTVKAAAQYGVGPGLAMYQDAAQRQGPLPPAYPILGPPVPEGQLPPVAPVARSRASGGIAARQRDLEQAAPVYVDPTTGTPVNAPADAIAADPVTGAQPVAGYYPVARPRASGGIADRQREVEGQQADAANQAEFQQLAQRQEEIDQRLSEISDDFSPAAEVERQQLQQESVQISARQAELVGGQGEGMVGFDLGGLAAEGLGILDKPRQWAATQLGGLGYRIATGNADAAQIAASIANTGAIGQAADALGIGPGDFLQWAADHPDEVIDAHDNGYDSDGDGVVDFTGDRAVWEAYQGDRNRIQRGVTDATIDPLNYLGVIAGLGERVAAGARAVRTSEEANTLVRAIAGALEATGNVARVPTAIIDKPVDEALGAIGRGLRAATGPLLNETRTATIRRTLGDIGDTLAGTIARDADEVIENVPTGAAPAPPRAGAAAAAPNAPRPGRPEPGPTLREEVDTAVRETEQAAVPEADVPGWRTKPPATSGELNETPWPVRPRPNGNPVIRTLANDPEAWRAVMDDVADESEQLVRVMDRVKTTPKGEGDIPTYDAVLAEGRFRASLDESVARHRPDIQRPKGRTIRQPGETGAMREAGGAPMEHILNNPWAQTSKDRQAFHSSGVFASTPARAARNPEAGARYVSVIDTHARLVPEDLYGDAARNIEPDPNFVEDVADAERVLQSLREAGAETPDTVVVGATAPQAETAPIAAPGSAAEPSGGIPEPSRPLSVQRGGAKEWYVMREPAAAGQPAEYVAGPFLTKPQAQADMAARLPQAAPVQPVVGASPPPPGQPGTVTNARPVQMEAPPTVADALGPTPSPAPGRQWRGRDIGDFEAAALDRKLADGTTVEAKIDPLIEKGVKAGKTEQAALVDSLKEVLEGELLAMGHVRGTGVFRGFLKLWDHLSNLLKKMQLYNIARVIPFFFANFIGNPISELLARHPDAAIRSINPRSFYSTFRYVRDLGKGEEASLPGFVARLVDSLQVGTPGAQIMQVVRDETEELARRSEQGVLRRLGMNWASPATETVGFFFNNKWGKELVTAADLHARLSLWTTQMERLLPETAEGFANALAERAARAGLDEAAIRAAVRPIAEAANPGAKPGRLMDALKTEVERIARAGGMGADEARTFARTAQQDAIAAVKGANDAAKAEVKRVLFTATETNLDAVVRRLAFFHFWNSRASLLYAREAIRTPGLAAGYLRMVEAIRDQAKDENAPPWLDSWLQLGATPLGMSIFLNPLTFFSTSFLLSDESSGQQWWNPFRYTMLNPILDMAVYVLGGKDGIRKFLTGSTEQMGPPPIPGVSALSRLFTAGANLANATLNDDGSLITDPSRRILPTVREKLTGQGAANPNASEIATLNALIIAEGQRMGYSEEEIRAAMDDPSDPAYQAAYDRYSRQAGVREVVRSTSPVPTQMIDPTRANFMAAARPGSRTLVTPEGQVAAELPRPGWNPYADGVLSLDDLDWLRQHYRETGEWLGPQDFERMEADTAEAQDLYRAGTAGSDMARRLEGESGDYHDIGTPRQQFAQQRWESIAYGPITGAVVIDGQRYTEEDIQDYYERQVPLVGEEAAAELVQQLRYQLADADLEQLGLTGEREALQRQRDRYKQEHPTYAQYADWAGAVRDTPGGPEAWWEAQALDNPSAAQFLEEARAEGLEGEELDIRLTGTSAYLAVRGQRNSLYDEQPPGTGPTPVVVASNDTGGGGGSSSGGSRMADNAVNIAGDLADYQAGQAAVDAVLGPDFHPWGWMGEAIANNRLAAAGVEQPQLSGLALDYVQWTQEQPPGADLSIIAFLGQRQANRSRQEANALPWLLSGGGPDVAAQIAPSLASNDPYTSFVARRGGSTGVRVR